MRTLRRKLHQLAGCTQDLSAWRDALVQQWSRDEPVAMLCVDGHVHVYHGMGRLPKHFVPREQLALKADVDYWLNSPGGAPLLFLHEQVDPHMVAEIEGWCPKLFRQLAARRVACIT